MATDAAHVDDTAAMLLHVRHSSLDAKHIPHHVGVQYTSPICAGNIFYLAEYELGSVVDKAVDAAPSLCRGVTRR